MFLIFGFPGVLVVLLTLYIATMLGAMAFESSFAAFADTLVLLGILVFFFQFNPIQTIIDHPYYDIAAVIGYVVAGVCWSAFKWAFFSLKELRRYERERAAFMKRNVKPGMTPEQVAVILKSFHAAPSSTGFKIKPVASENKNRIVAWMMWWPFSMLWTLINDPIKKFFKALFELLRGTYQRITDRIFAKYAMDLNASLEPSETWLDRKPPNRFSPPSPPQLKE